MKVLSNNFEHLDEISNEFTLNNKNLSPQLYWTNNNVNTTGFLIIMTNMKNNNIHWMTLTNNQYLNLNEKTNLEKVNYVGPNDKMDVVTYIIDVYALRNCNIEYPYILDNRNVLDRGYIKFIYNGF
jgi:hypothetical protein